MILRVPSKQAKQTVGTCVSRVPPSASGGDLPAPGWAPPDLTRRICQLLSVLGTRYSSCTPHRPGCRHQRNISASAEMIFGRASGGAPRSATQTIMTLVIADTPIITATAQTPTDCHRPSHTNLISDIKPHLSRGAPARRRMRKCFGHPAGSVAVVQSQL